MSSITFNARSSEVSPLTAAFVQKCREQLNRFLWIWGGGERERERADRISGTEERVDRTAGVSVRQAQYF
jgi:hypothetical protein